jgi:hypothetical protein
MRAYSECHALDLRDEICRSNRVHGLEGLLNRDIDYDLFTLSKVLRLTNALSRDAKLKLLTNGS